MLQANHNAWDREEEGGKESEEETEDGEEKGQEGQEEKGREEETTVTWEHSGVPFVCTEWGTRIA